jgi:hypothetical protein
VPRSFPILFWSLARRCFSNLPDFSEEQAHAIADEVSAKVSPVAAACIVALCVIAGAVLGYVAVGLAIYFEVF